MKVIFVILFFVQVSFGQTRERTNPAQTSDVTPQTSAAWTDISQAYAVRGLFNETFNKPGGSQLIQTLNVNNSSSTASTLFAQHVSPPLQAQTISGTVKGQFRMSVSGTTGCTANSMIVITVVNAAGVIQATLLSATQGNLALSTTTQNRSTPAAGTALTSYTCNTGDRIVIETGIVRTAGTTARTGSIVYTAGTSSGDLPEDNTTTTSNYSWIEFSNTINFYQGNTNF